MNRLLSYHNFCSASTISGILNENIRPEINLGYIIEASTLLCSKSARRRARYPASILRLISPLHSL